MFSISILVAPACGALDGKSCTEIGCRNSASVRLLSVDGAHKAYQMTVLADGRSITCTTPPFTGSGDVSSRPCSAPEVSVSIERLVDCTETRNGDAVSQSCVPNGELAQTLTFDATPSQVVVELVEESGATFERTFTLQYRTVMPNGPECEPACLQSNDEWVVQ